MKKKEIEMLTMKRSIYIITFLFIFAKNEIAFAATKKCNAIIGDSLSDCRLSDAIPCQNSTVCQRQINISTINLFPFTEMSSGKKKLHLLPLLPLYSLKIKYGYIV